MGRRWRGLADDNQWGAMDFGTGFMTLARGTMVGFGGGEGLGDGHVRGGCRGAVLSLNEDVLIRG
eukprot:2420596-Ditylum_brightwellii.AAC.1